MEHWMFNCKEVTRRVSESLDRDLPIHQRVGIRFHLLMCKFCSRYRKQLLFLRELAHWKAEPDEERDASVRLPTEARDRMKQAMGRYSKIPHNE